MTSPLELLRAMTRIRLVEEEIAKRYSDQEMRCPVHLSIGQESVAVGISATLDRTDWAFSGHRNHAHYLAKGGNLNSMIAENCDIRRNVLSTQPRSDDPYFTAVCEFRKHLLR